MMCRSYDPAIRSKCRKETADIVNNKVQANYCHHFKPRANAYKTQASSKMHQAHDELAALFGQTDSRDDEPSNYEAKLNQAKSELGDLFGDVVVEENELSPEEKARRELEKLFERNSE